MKQDVVDFEFKFRKLWDEYKSKLTHGEMVGTCEIVKLDYMVGTLLDNTVTEPGGDLKLPGESGSPIPERKEL